MCIELRIEPYIIDRPRSELAQDIPEAELAQYPGVKYGDQIQGDITFHVTTIKSFLEKLFKNVNPCDSPFFKLSDF